MKKIVALLISLIAVISVSTHTIAQQKFLFNSTYVVNEPSDIELLKSIRLLFNDLMILNGAELSEKEHTLFLLNISQKIGDEYYAISITSLHSLPESIIQSGKNGQVFYTNLSDETLTILTEEQAQVREFMSENYIRQFYSILDSRMLVVTRKTIESELEIFVKEYILKWE